MSAKNYHFASHSESPRCDQEKDRHIDKIPGNPNQYEIQTIALFWTSQLLKRVLLKCINE